MSEQQQEDVEVPEDVEAERERRLDPANRPENAEVDNSDAELPTVEEYAERERAEREAAREDGVDSGGTSDPSEKFRAIEVSEEERAELEAERERRLDPDNRPPNTEIDNTGDDMPEFARTDEQPDDD